MTCCPMSTPDTAAHGQTSTGLDDLPQRMRDLDIGPEDHSLLIAAWPLVSDERDNHFELLNQGIRQYWADSGSTPDQQECANMRRMQHLHVKSIFCSDIDMAYINDRLKVGRVHHRIGLEPHRYLASCQTLMTALQQSLREKLSNAPDLMQATISALSKRFFLDMGIVMTAYVLADRHALKQSNSSLRQSQTLLNEAQEIAQLACWELRLPEGQLQACTRAQALLMVPATAQRDGWDALRQWVHPQDRLEVEKSYQDALRSGGTYDVRYRVQHPAHPLRMIRERGRVELRKRGIKRVIGTLQDISLQVNQLSRIEQLALYDDLTGLPNRANVLSSLQVALNAARDRDATLAVLFIDLDDFKEINDTLGHNVGDTVLTEVARRLRGCLRSDELIARLGGDEFVVIAQGVDLVQAQGIAHRLTGALSRPLQVAGTNVSSRASIGIALYPGDGDSSELLLRNADTAMYAAKRQKSGVAIYREEMSEELVRRVQVASRLNVALEKGDFTLHFQPQVVLETGELVGAEALIRWQDAQLGAVPTAEFIGLAEQRGMIDRVGDWVVNAACRQLQHWDQLGLKLPGQLALNISPRQFNDVHYAHRLRRQVEQHNISPRRLDLEVTETSLMADPAISMPLMHQLRSEGFSLSLDDFGMGYSSLTHLKDFPLDRIKLDRSFINGMLEDPHDHAIVVATLGMATGLGLDVVAEGVEKPEQATVLSALGCRYAQGFHYGRPLAADDFATQWLQPLAEATAS